MPRWTMLPNDRDAEDASRGGGPMAGAMRRMGIYLGLVEDDDARAYGRYDARLDDHPEHDRRYGRYGADDYDGRYGDPEYATGAYGDDLGAEEPPAREPEPLPVRRAGAARPLGLAPTGAASAGPSRV